MDSSQQPAFARVENGEEAIAQKPGFSAKYQEGRFERSRTWLSGHDIKLNFESYGCGVKETSDYLKGPKCLFSCKSGLVYPISSATTWSQDRSYEMQVVKATSPKAQVGPMSCSRGEKNPAP